MAYRLPGSLTARITIGFVVLVVTFAGVSLSNVRTIERLNQWIRITHDGYLQLALVSGDLDSTQVTLRSYLREELGEESSERRARSRLQKLITRRAELLVRSEGILADVGSLVASDSTHEKVKKHYAEAETMVQRIRTLVDESAANYEALLLHPPIARSGDRPRTDQEVEVLKVRTKQLLLDLKIGQLSEVLKHGATKMVLRLSVRLDVLSRRIWIYTLVFSGLALVLGILMTIAARVMLRPLQRLGDAAGRIARGDYAHRISVRGPKEIAELAQEFNVMGQAIEERSVELVRTERLATAGKMAAMITHEVRNPLSSIGLNTELLEEELAALPEDRAPEAQALCRAITKEVDRLTEITEEYLQLARLPTPKPQEESLERIAESVVSFNRDQLKSRGVSVDLSIEETPSLSLDEGQIRQALLNLVRNAVDAVQGQEEASVLVSVRMSGGPGEGGSVLLEVADNGPGIPEEIMPRIFEAFVSGKSSGTGLGLALTQQIISDHGATIEARNDGDGGAVFCIEFPLAPTNAPS
ncbi:MAG: HAMP domain-containing histidine kinase [Myxococcales bacterium]|nr:HAMP domain-containing histidine kinase [Myxococcales bacterium]